MNFKKPSLPNINFAWLNWVTVAVVVAVIAALYLDAAWNAFAPMFHLPAMTMPEALGTVMLLAPLVALVVGLRESKS